MSRHARTEDGHSAVGLVATRGAMAWVRRDTTTGDILGTIARTGLIHLGQHRHRAGWWTNLRAEMARW